MIIEDEQEIEKINAQDIVTALAEQGGYAKFKTKDGKEITITIEQTQKEAGGDWQQE